MYQIRCAIALLFAIAAPISAERSFFTRTSPGKSFLHGSFQGCPISYRNNFRRPKLTVGYGGWPTNIGDFPHMAAIGHVAESSETFFCGGSLISPKFVLTAAHCSSLNSQPANVVRLGDTYLYNEEDDKFAQQIEIQKFIRHPEHHHRRKYFDIALVELKQEAKLGEYVCPACIWLQDEILSLGKVTAIGFGITGIGMEMSPKLLKFELEPLQADQCTDQLPPLTRSLPEGLVGGQFCAASVTADTCEGDSGGPIQTQIIDDYNVWVPQVVGIVSFGTACHLGSVGVYTRVAAHKDWIEQTIQSPLEESRSCSKAFQCIHHTLKYSYNRFSLTWTDERPVERNLCEATLVDYRFALTSAFCAALNGGSPSNIREDRTGEEVAIERIFLHPNFTRGHPENDIALLMLAQYLNRDQVHLFPTCLWRGDTVQNETKLNDYGIITEGEVCANFSGIVCLTVEPTQKQLVFGSPVYARQQKLYGVVSKLSEGHVGSFVVTKLDVEWIESVLLDHGDELVFTN